jgi:cell pole-organizing protein PopZ
VLTSSIFTDFRIYGVVLPQVRLEKRIYELQNHAASLTEVFAKVQLAIDAQKAKGKDVSVWQANLDATKTLVVKDTEKLSSLFTQISALKPSDYGTTSKATIESVNIGVKAVAKDFQSIRSKIRRPEILKNTTATTTVTVTGTTTINTSSSTVR